MTCQYVAHSNGKLNRLLCEISRYNSEEDVDLDTSVADEQMIHVETYNTDRSRVSTDFEDGGVPATDGSGGSNKPTQVERLSSADIKLEQAQKGIAVKGITSFLRTVRQSAFICALTAWTLFLLKVTFIFYVIFWTHYLDTNLTPMIKYITVSRELMLLVRAIVFIIYAYNAAASSFAPTMSLLFALLFWQQFKSFNRRFKASIRGRQFQGEFGLYRLRHQRLSNLVDKADKMLWLCNGGNLVCHSVSTIVLLYGLVFYGSTFPNKFMLCLVIFYLLSSVYEILLTSFGAILVNDVVIVSSLIS